MATHYIENGNSGSQYYFDSNSNSTSQDRAYTAPVTATASVVPSEYSPYAAGVSGARSQHQQMRSEQNAYDENDPYQLPQQQHQSVAGFNKPVSQQQYQSSPSSTPQVRATVRSVNSQEQQYASSAQQPQQQPTQQRQQVYVHYDQQSSPQSSPQQQQYQYDPRQQSGQQPGGSAYYQAPGSAQYSHHEVDQRTESPSRSRDQHVQVFMDASFLINNWRL